MGIFTIHMRQLEELFCFSVGITTTVVISLYHRKNKPKNPLDISFPIVSVYSFFLFVCGTINSAYWAVKLI